MGVVYVTHQYSCVYVNLVLLTESLYFTLNNHNTYCIAIRNVNRVGCISLNALKCKKK